MILHLIELFEVPILEQLQLEEALLRTTPHNICMINYGAPDAIVLGISSKVEELVDPKIVKETSLPLIRRYSGGGTVLIDPHTLFVSFIGNHSLLNGPPFPEPILRWSAEIYQKAWKFEGFALKENDYVIDQRKCGGNAQYLTKDRFVHHTSFLWDFCPEKMRSLVMPTKRPAYRENRAHQDFLCTLKNHGTIPELIALLKIELSSQFTLKKLEKLPKTFPEHRKATKKLC